MFAGMAAKQIEKLDQRLLDVEYALSRNEGLAAHPKDFDWVEKNIPCQAACPAKTDVPGYLEAVYRGDFDTAYKINLEDNVFPAVLGRVCTRPCEPACRHGWEGLGDPVAICFSKRSADDFMSAKAPVALEPVFTSTGKTVAVVGSGAAGLTVARELQRWGHQVTVFEKFAEPGGLMVQGIPEFRLPRAVVQREVEQVALTGVTIRCGVEIGKDLPLAELESQHDAVILCAGTWKPNLPEWPGVHLPGVRHGVDFLQEANRGGEPAVGSNVVVIGGGFTSVDCARMAKRLGAETVGMYYRRTEEEMYVTGHELEAFKEEDIDFQTLVTPVSFNEDNGALTSVTFVRCALGDPEEDGRRRPVEQPDTRFDVPVDLVLLGTGQAADASWAEDILKANPEHVFLAGDFITGPGSLIDAIGHAKSCARDVDRSLQGTDRFTEAVRIEPVSRGETGRPAENNDIPQQPMPCLAPAERGLRAEVETGLDQETSRTEAGRCYFCHYKFEIDNDLCIYCDRCLKVMPVENCIVKVSHLIYDQKERITGYTKSTTSRDYNHLYLDQNECIRCGACVEVCPVDCITLEKVNPVTVPVRD